MGFFGKRTKMISCPICRNEFESTSTGARLNHWEQHVRPIPEGQGEASGQYTWECACGPSGMKWPRIGDAAAGMALHMNNRHGIEI